MNKQFPYEFGGPIGNLSIISFSHIILYYLYWCLGVDDWMPTVFTVTTYVAFIAIEAILAVVMPGVWTQGLPLRDRKTLKTYSLDYLCNGLSSWYMTLILLFGVHYFGYFKIYWITDNIGSYMTTSVIFADLSSLIIYLWGLQVDTSREDERDYNVQMENLEEEMKNVGESDERYPELVKHSHSFFERWRSHRRDAKLSGNHVYDFFMGSILNPRIGILDLKMFAEIRISWMLLFLITTANALKQLEEYGKISNSMIVIWVAQTLYTNACMKGEECIPTTWDIFHEKFGWMLVFWNSELPFLYALQSYYIYTNNISISTVGFIILLIVLSVAYYVWDTANSQKNRFRMQQRGTYVRRKWAYPQFKWGTLKDPEYMTTRAGSKLLIDGWWKIARKIHYTADLTMALVWATCCGYGSFIPYFYFCFFLTHLIHRVNRDTIRCKQKYGEDWDKYCETVPYIFIPYIY